MYKKEGKYLIYDKERSASFKQLARNIINSLERIIFKVIYFFVRPSWSSEAIHNVSICAIFRDEGDYLREWIEYHIIAGVEHFYLYNNFSQDNYYEVLEPYIGRGLITLKDWPIKQGQYSAYKDFFENHSKETKWVCLIDIDEFIVPRNTDSINDFLELYKYRPCVIVYWKMFGAAGMMDRKVQGLVTEDFFISSRKHMDIGKVFVNTKYTFDLECDKSNSMHSLWMKYKWLKLPPVNVFDKVCTHGINPVGSQEMPIQINHYVTKSYQEYLTKKSKRGGGVHDIGMHDTEYFFHHDQLCQSSDYSAYKYLTLLKLKLAEKKH